MPGKASAPDYFKIYSTLIHRYGTIKPDEFIKVVVPLCIPLDELTPTFKDGTKKLVSLAFKVTITAENEQVLVPGRTGKFVPQSYTSGAGVWKEIAKGRILRLDRTTSTATGEVYVGSGNRITLASVYKELTRSDFLEIDQYGAAAKGLSGLSECALSLQLQKQGFKVFRMPEDTAKSVGSYRNYDFEVIKGSDARRIELKSLWGTNTDRARLIHSTGKDYPTSSCKFATQDFFAVNLFLRTGNIENFLFARSLSTSTDPQHGLPPVKGHAGHVNQNPECKEDNKVWFTDLSKIWPGPTPPAGSLLL